jgi:hypothetical protein
METRAHTIVEKFGFKDLDRSNYMHDEIQIWVYYNFKTIVRQVFPNLSLDDYPTLDLKLEYAVTKPNTNNIYVVGFIDVYCKALSIAIEVKTKIPVIGDLIRQIQLYRKYMTSPQWIVVSPDDRAAAILKGQGIHYFKFEDRDNHRQLNLFR